MALIKCKECEKEVSDQAETCPGCGARVKPKSKALLYAVLVPIGLVILFLGYGAILPLTRTPAEQAAIEARRACEKVFPTERGRRCDQVYSDAYKRESAKAAKRGAADNG